MFESQNMRSIPSIFALVVCCILPGSVTGNPPAHATVDRMITNKTRSCIKQSSMQWRRSINSAHIAISIGVVGIAVASAGGWVYSIIPSGKNASRAAPRSSESLMMPNLYFLVSESRSCLSSLISDVNLLMAFAISATVDCNDSRSALLLPLQATDSGASPTLSGFPVSMVATGRLASLELPSPLFRERKALSDCGHQLNRGLQHWDVSESVPPANDVNKMILMHEVYSNRIQQRSSSCCKRVMSDLGTQD